MTETSNVAPIVLMQTVFTSEFVPPLFSGAETHEPSLRLIAQLVKHTADDGLIEALVTAALPKDYSGDTIAELSGMIAGARKKGFDKTAPKSAEFEMTESGLVHFKLTGKSVIPVNVSGPFEVLGLVRDTASSGWAHLLRWRDADDREHEFTASDRLLLGDHDLVCGDMAEQGLRISKGQQGNLARYILAIKIDARATSVNRIGWHKIGESDVFVLPSQVIGDPPTRVLYEGGERRQEEYSARGSLSEWRLGVSLPAQAHSLAALAISTAFAGPLLHVAGLESGGLHLFGSSSTGKTTLLKLAASVWGEQGVVLLASDCKRPRRRRESDLRRRLDPR